MNDTLIVALLGAAVAMIWHIGRKVEAIETLLRDRLPPERDIPEDD